MSPNYSVLAGLPDDQLLAEVTRLATRERQATADLVASLGVLDERRLYLREGYSSLFSYCTKALGLSEDAAYFRIEAARVARRLPLILERLANGAITLTGVKLLAPHFTEDNCQALLDAARGKSKREIEETLVRLQPRPDVPSSVRKLPTRQTALGTLAAPTSSASALPSPAPPPVAADDRVVAAASALLLSSVAAIDHTAPIVCPVAPRPRPPVVAPLAPERYKVQMTVSAETYGRLRRAQALLRHAIPDGDPAAIFDRALTLLVEQLERRKWGARTGRTHARRSDGAEAVNARTRERLAGRAHDAGRRTAGSSALHSTTSSSSATERAMPVAALSRGSDSPSDRKVPADGDGDVSAVELVPERVRSAERPSQVRHAEPQRIGPGVHQQLQRGSRRLPAAVRRAVWQREGGRCGYVSASGKRCEATSNLQFHHLLPCADGGQATVDGLRLLCVAHHALETERWFGEFAQRE